MIMPDDELPQVSVMIYKCLMYLLIIAYYNMPAISLPSLHLRSLPTPFHTGCYNFCLVNIGRDAFIASSPYRQYRRDDAENVC